MFSPADDDLSPGGCVSLYTYNQQAHTHTPLPLTHSLTLTATKPVADISLNTYSTGLLTVSFVDRIVPCNVNRTYLMAGGLGRRCTWWGRLGLSDLSSAFAATGIERMLKLEVEADCFCW